MKVQTIVRAEAARKVEWQQAAKDAGLSLNAWCVLALDAAASEPELVGRSEPTATPVKAVHRKADIEAGRWKGPDFKK